MKARILVILAFAHVVHPTRLNLLKARRPDIVCLAFTHHARLPLILPLRIKDGLPDHAVFRLDQRVQSTRKLGTVF
jgi:hypothetical protein